MIVPEQNQTLNTLSPVYFNDITMYQVLYHKMRGGSLHDVLESLWHNVCSLLQLDSEYPRCIMSRHNSVHRLWDSHGQCTLQMLLYPNKNSCHGASLYTASVGGQCNLICWYKVCAHGPLCTAVVEYFIIILLVFICYTAWWAM